MADKVAYFLHTQLTRHPQNMRLRYDLATVRRMAVSQADRAGRGQDPCVQALVVTPGVGETHYDSRIHRKLTIVAGHLRHAGNAYLGARAPRLNCIVRCYADEAALLADMSAENGIRSDPGPVTWARHYQAQIAGGKTLKQVARDAGQSLYTVTDRLQLLELGQVAQDLIDAGALPLSAGEALLRLTDGRQQAAAARRFAKLGFNVRQMAVAVETMVARLTTSPSERKPPKVQRIITAVHVRGPAVPSLVGMPAQLPATLDDLRSAARLTCAACEMKPKTALEPAWHLATAAAGEVCTACDLRLLKDGCNGCPLPEALSRVTRALAGKRPANGAHA